MTDNSQIQIHSYRDSSIATIGELLKDQDSPDKSENKLNKNNHIPNQSVIKIGKDHVIGLSHIDQKTPSTYSLICKSLAGGYILTLDASEVQNVLQNNHGLKQEFDEYIAEEKRKIFG